MPVYSNDERTGAVAFSLTEYREDYQLSDHLTLGELACDDGSDIVLVHPDLPIAFEHLRESLSEMLGRDVPLFVNSGYRTLSHNAEIGGAKKSYHPYGMAVDLRSDIATPEQIAQRAQPFFGGIGLYGSFCHCDVGPERSWRT